MNELIQFLNKHKVEGHGNFTHTSLGAPFKGKFLIEDSELEEFYSIYEKTNSQLHITEKRKDVCPVLVDLDFNYKPDGDNLDRRYTLDHIKKVVSYYQVEILNSLKGDATAFVLEKGPRCRKVKDKIKDGLHIVFPYILTSTETQLVMRKKIIAEISQDNVFADMPDLVNSVWDIFDEAVIKSNPWLMYGSCKDGEEYSWSTSHIIDSTGEERSLDRLDFLRLLSIRNKSVDISPFKSEEIIKEYTQIYEENYKPKKKESKLPIFLNKLYNIETIRSLLNLLNPDRYSIYEKWRDVGFCLHNISTDLFQIYIDFSKQSSKFQDGDCEKIWEKANPGIFTIGTLFFWAKNDSPEKYKEFRKTLVYAKIAKSLVDGTDYSVAEVLHVLYGHEYVLASVKDDLWYEYISKNHHWKLCEKGIFLRKRISTDLYNEYVEYEKMWMEHYYNNLSDDEKAEKQEEHKKVHESLSKMYCRLKTTKFKNDIMKSAQELFYYDDRTKTKFLEMLDEKRDLIGFKNGVFDLSAPVLDKQGNPVLDSKGRECKGIFRDGKPDDYISLSTNINYIPYNPKSEYTFRCIKFIREIFPETDMYEYILTLFSYFITGFTSEEKFWIFIGNSANGKTKLLELLKHAMGDYYGTMMPTILTTKRGASDNASPELAKTKGKRFISISEPEKSDVIQGGFTKLISGGDPISCRKLFKDPIEFKPQFKMAMLTNYFLAINTTDDGIFRRLRAGECKTKFCDNPEPGNIYQCKIDMKIAESLPLWAEAFMSILIHYYTNTYIHEGLKEPEQVKVYTRKYQEDVDTLLAYVNEFIVEDKPDNLLRMKEVYTHFKHWFKEQNDGLKAPLMKDIKESMEKKYGKCKTIGGQSSSWKGISLKSEHDITNTEDSKVINNTVNIGILNAKI